MGRHARPDQPDAAGAPDRPRRIALAVRHTIPAPTQAPPGLDVTTLTIRPLGPPAALGATPRPDARADTPVPPAGPPARLSRRERRAARHEEADRAALAARIARAQRRNRQVAASGVPAPRSADPSSVSGPLSIDALAAARPPWSGVAVPSQRS
ncbi:hypothetical protein EV188_10420 [Actinomycetospora succinea]|uniref:Uncharacterized protein n=1 Tax=Actinomycetospora succinea TaxID=663603 RepID=A0A4R6VCL0_9PSEU|nr:hypothetical protein [Actinomycetospora succinea]TDQ58281.1 hypothetical protein EV188_10420 [Actinomycetospora succinea]